jgi:hypothetical protein
MPRFKEDVTIVAHALVLNDESGAEIARLDQEGNLVMQGALPPRRAEILRFLAATAELTIGTPGVDIDVDDPLEDPGTHLPGRPGTVRVMGDADLEAILLRGADATVQVGTGDVAGNLVILSGSRREVFRVEGAAVHVGAEDAPGEVLVRDDAGREAFHLDGSTATLEVGVIGNEGDVTVRDGDGRQAFHLNGGTATLYVGGLNTSGEVIVRDLLERNAVRMNGDDATIWIGVEGVEGDLFVRDALGRQVCHLDGESANLYLGTEGKAGDVIIRDDQGTDRIQLIGSTGDIKLFGADVAEDFDTATAVSPGAVVVAVGPDEVAPAATALDRRVVGVASGAGDWQPALRLASRPGAGRVPVAIVGRVQCQADATHGAIATGDLLTTSATEGHAMRVADPAVATGAILGKALAPLEEGTGLIPVLLTLR